MTAAQVLRDARKRIEKEENWIQGKAYVPSTGWWLWKTPARFCLIGALYVDPKKGHMLFTRANADADSFLTRVTAISFSGFNDSHTHAEVLAALDAAIALAETDEVAA